MRLNELLQVVELDLNCQVFSYVMANEDTTIVSNVKPAEDLEKEFRDDVLGDWPVTFVSVNRNREGKIVMSIVIMKPSLYEKGIRK